MNGTLEYYICMLAFYPIASNQMMWILGKQASVFVDCRYNVIVVRVFFSMEIVLSHPYIMYYILFYFVCMQIKGNTEKGCKTWMINSRLYWNDQSYITK